MSDTQRSSPGGQRQELVFCHQCENEWYKSGQGITCPRCQSDFTEIIEHDFDPRATNEPTDTLHSHNPWETVDDPDEDDIEAFGPVPSFGQPRTMPGSFHAHNRGGNGNTGSFQQVVLGDFASMIQSMTGLHGFPANFPPPRQDFSDRGNNSRPQSQPGTRPAGSGMTFTQQQSGPGFRMTWSTTSPAFTFSSFTSPSSGSPLGVGRAPGRNGMPMADMEQFMGSLFGPNFPGAARTRGGAGAGAGSPFSALIASMLDPINASHGDAVFSQEALDRVVSQLMEQNPGGSAPGPATQTAIRGLPKKRLTPDMLDENTGQAECSICMDNVPVGEEVTTLPCSHWFHYECVEAWLKEHDTCPVCRRGITPKDGSRDTVRCPAQAPLHDEDPALLARRQSGTRENPFVVDESPTRERRRRPSSHRYGSTEEGASAGPAHGAFDRVRNFFSGGNNGGASGSGSRRSSSGGRR